MKNWKIKISEYSFTLKTFDRGVFFPITRTIKSGIFGLVAVNYEEGSMPIKYNALFMNKQHPSEYWPPIGQNWSHHLVSYWSGQSDMYFVYIKIFQTTQGFPAQSSI